MKTGALTFRPPMSRLKVDSPAIGSGLCCFRQCVVILGAGSKMAATLQQIYVIHVGEGFCNVKHGSVTFFPTIPVLFCKP